MISVLVIFTYISAVKGCNTYLKPLDIVYMLDKSGSIGVNNWQKQIEFLKNLTEHLDVSVNRTRVAALQHATKADVMFGFDDKTSRKEVIDALDLNIHQQTSGNSKYHRALNYSLHGIFKSPLRQKARKFIIGLTDDMDNQSLSDKTKQYVREAEEKAINVITICMKLHTWDCAEASTPGYNVSVHRAGKLNEALPDVIQLICPSAVNTSTCECTTNCVQSNDTKYRTKAKIEELKQALKLDKKSLSKTKRGKTSAEDKRFSSAMIGYCSVSMLAIVGSWIVIPDVWTLINWTLNKIRIEKEGYW